MPPPSCPVCGEIAKGFELTEDPERTRAYERSWDSSQLSSLRPEQLAVPGYEVLEMVGRGGMGVVYKARQLSLNRTVALKVLQPEFAADPESLRRFRGEAEVMGNLTESHILPVFDVLEANGARVLVMPFMDGTDLGRIIRDRYALRQGRAVSDPHPWAGLSDADYLRRMLPVLDQLIDAVTAMHAAGVLHRDIKPSNVLVDRRGNAWLTDFGLSRLSARTLQTGRGEVLGTFGFMPPEQAAGELEVDARSDLFALGATAYQALTLELPFGHRGARPSDPLPTAPSRRQRLLSRDYDAVVLKALEPERGDRYETAAGFQDDWQLARQGLVPRARRLGPVGRLARRLRRKPWPALAGLLLSATLALLLAIWLRPVPVPVPPPPAMERTVKVTTDPPGARIVLVPIDEQPFDHTDGEPLPGKAIRPPPEQTTPLTLERVPPGTYLVVAKLADHRFHEVYRTVPLRGAQPAGSFPHQRWTLTDDTVELPTIAIPESPLDRPIEQGMARFGGGAFVMGHPPETGHISVPHQRSVAAFYLDSAEVTIGEYRRFSRFLTPSHRGFKTPPPDAHPISFVTWPEALAYAEKAGKRLPMEAEYEYAATMAGTRKFPWGDDDKRLVDWPIGPVRQPDWDRTPTDPPVFGLYSNVAEWTVSMQGPYPGVVLPPPPTGPIAEQFLAGARESRVVRGGPFSVVVGYPNREEWGFGARFRQGVSASDRHPGLGFRCARSARPRFLD